MSPHAECFFVTGPQGMHLDASYVQKCYAQRTAPQLLNLDRPLSSKSSESGPPGILLLAGRQVLCMS